LNYVFLMVLKHPPTGNPPLSYQCVDFHRMIVIRYLVLEAVYCLKFKGPRYLPTHKKSSSIHPDSPCRCNIHILHIGKDFLVLPSLIQIPLDLITCNFVHSWLSIVRNSPASIDPFMDHKLILQLAAVASYGLVDSCIFSIQ